MNKKGFTLIELLAVIIILGILMIIAIPSVTKYISDSRKSSYVDTAKEIIAGARNVVNDGKLGMYDTNMTYYIPVSYIKTENALKSPYGEFVKDAAYVVVTFDGKGYKYYWISVDDAGQGVKRIVSYDKLDIDDIESDIDPDEIKNIVEHTGIGNRTEIKILQDDNTWRPKHLDNTSNNITEEGADNSGNSGTQKIICKRAQSLHSDLSYSYGHLGSGDTLVSGDAFDCDVNGDETYSAETERFYYMYSSGDIANLIYYVNVRNGEPNKGAKTSYAYINNGSKGPVSASKQLPTTEQWITTLSNNNRQIYDYLGNTSVENTDLVIFDYTGRAARLPSYQDAINSCGGTDARDASYFVNKNCIYFMENIIPYDYDGAYGYLSETLDTHIGGIMTFYGYTSKIDSVAADNGNLYGVRPVIEVPISQIEK